MYLAKKQQCVHADGQELLDLCSSDEHGRLHSSTPSLEKLSFGEGTRVREFRHGSPGSETSNVPRKACNA